MILSLRQTQISAVTGAVMQQQLCSIMEAASLPVSISMSEAPSPATPSPTAAAAHPLHQKAALQGKGRERGWERTRLSVSTPP